MFDGLTKKLAEKMGKSAKEAVKPIIAESKQAATHKVDLYSRVLRLGVLVFLFIDGTRRITDTREQESSPNQIIINNYMHDPNPKEGR